MSDEIVTYQQQQQKEKEKREYNAIAFAPAVMTRALGHSINLYPLENYTFGVKEAMLEKDASVRLYLRN